MKKLIQGEKIGIDNHQPGVPWVWNSNQDIHLHKTTTIRRDGSQISVDVRIPLNSDRKISIVPNKANVKPKEGDRTRNLMIKEIREAFESPQNAGKCDEFLKNLIDEMNRINGSSPQKTLEDVEKVFDRIMRFFDLGESIKGRMEQIADEYFKPYIDGKRNYYLFEDTDRIEIGELTREEERRFSDKGFFKVVSIVSFG